MRAAVTVARLGGDEFAVILEEQVEAPEAASAAGRAICDLPSPYKLREALTVEVGASVGVAFHPLHGAGAADEREAVIHAADKAMYHAKRLGKNQSVLAALADET